MNTEKTIKSLRALADTLERDAVTSPQAGEVWEIDGGAKVLVDSDRGFVHLPCGTRAVYDHAIRDILDREGVRLGSFDQIYGGKCS
jgi:hypothetical protein